MRVSDKLLRINIMNLINEYKKPTVKTLLRGDGTIKVLRQKKSLDGEVVTHLDTSTNGQEESSVCLEDRAPGISDEPGRPATTEGSFSLGDRDSVNSDAAG